MRTLIVGFGSIGRRHFHNLLALGQKDIVLLRSLKSSLNTDELKNFQVVTDLQEALSLKPDAVILANPTALHLETAIPFAKQGSHLFFEKPISDSMEGIAGLFEALKMGGGRAVTGFQFRFHPGLQRVRRLLQESAVGEIISARAHWGEYLPGWHPWEDHRKSYSARKDLGGGVILTLSHPIDYLRWLLGPVAMVWAYYRPVQHLEIKVEASAEIGLEFAGGAFASVHLDYIQRPGRHDLEIIGDQGTIKWDNSNGQVHLFRAPSNSWETFEPPLNFERNDLFIAEMKHFLDVVENKSAAICTLEDGIEVQKIVDAAYRSYQEQRFIRMV
jgi:predicted dehydrogenase